MQIRLRRQQQFSGARRLDLERDRTHRLEHDATPFRAWFKANQRWRVPLRQNLGRDTGGSVDVESPAIRLPWHRLQLFRKTIVMPSDRPFGHRLSSVRQDQHSGHGCNRHLDRPFRRSSESGRGAVGRGDPTVVPFTDNDGPNQDRTVSLHDLVGANKAN